MTEPAEHTPGNVRRLALAVVESWDMSTLLEYAVDRLEAHYGRDTISFQEDWVSIVEEAT